MNKYCVYILSCSDQTLYTGISTDLKRRIDEHNNSQFGAKYTKSRRPVALLYSRKFKNRSLATKEELRIKKLTRQQKLNLIALNKKMKIINYQKIDSSQNSQMKLLAKLNHKKHRQELGLFTVENFTIISDALKDGYDFEALFITKEFANKHVEALKAIENNSQSNNFYLIDSKINKYFSNLDTPPGIIAIYKIKPQKLEKATLIYLNGISDPGNLGTIMRSALAFGFNNIVLDEGCVDIYNSKVINAAKDAMFKLNILEDKSVSLLKQTKLPIYATSSHVGSNLAKFRPTNSFCLVLGSESHGVSAEIIKLAKKTIKIEISHKIESLNVATAAAILFYEFRQK